MKYMWMLIAVILTAVLTGYSETRWVGTTSDWSDAANWTNGVPNIETEAVFGLEGSLTVDVPSGASAQKILFDPNGTSIQRDYVFNGGPMSLGSSAITGGHSFVDCLPGFHGDIILNVDLSLTSGTTKTILVYAPASYTFNGTITVNGAGWFVHGASTGEVFYNNSVTFTVGGYIGFWAEGATMHLNGQVNPGAATVGLASNGSPFYLYQEPNPAIIDSQILLSPYSKTPGVPTGSVYLAADGITILRKCAIGEGRDGAGTYTMGADIPGSGTATLAGIIQMPNTAFVTGHTYYFDVKEDDTLRINGQLYSGTADHFIRKIGPGTLLFDGPKQNSYYTGGFYIDEGVVACAKDNASHSFFRANPIHINAGGTLRMAKPGVEQVLDSAPIHLYGGTISTGTDTGASETLGLVHIWEDSAIELGMGDHTLTIADVNDFWGGGLTVYGWKGTGGQSGTDGKIVITNIDDISGDELATVEFSGYKPVGGMLIGNELVPAGDFCGGVFPGDLNLDCYVDLYDFALLGREWLECIDPLDPACVDIDFLQDVANDWLKCSDPTEPYCSSFIVP